MSDAPTASGAERLALVVGRLNRRMQAATGGLSHGLLSALAMIARHGPLRLSDLAQLESVSAPTMTRTVAELESRRLVERSADPEDGRAVLVAITDDGTDAILAARATRAAVVSELLERLAPAELAAISGALPALEHLTDVR
ncbi:MarR family winged helix-turn-helix transcriptional regulator [Lysinimonas soli]|uniref:MarR family winged helix-turn-helix transcriptional regulator n=1 Tax=Lysinimonas soli TaxID=1074233 RepID=A0ABW0NNU0_9MICO